MGAECGLHPIARQIIGINYQKFFFHGKGEHTGLPIRREGKKGLTGWGGGKDGLEIHTGLAVL